jgi:uncharacterized protein
MRYIDRQQLPELLKAVRAFPAVLLTGPRQCGKTTLLRHAFPKATYVLLEDPDTIARVRSDPRGFLDALALPVIIDEIQNAPELLGYIRSRIDAVPKRKGQWLLTGSQEAPLMQGVAESMAGRVAVLQLLPMSTLESSKVSLLRGGYPSVLSRPANSDLWFRSYLQTYLERDVRTVTAVKDLGTFRRFMALLATRCGSMLNRTDLSAPLGVSVPTISGWLDVLEITGQILVVPPFFENFGKRLVKAPKIYFTDSGLVCYLLGIDSLAALQKSAFHGPIFESFVAAEIVKQQINNGKRKELYYFRDQQGLEVDFIVPQGVGKLALIEAKASKSPTPAMAQSLQRLSANIERYRTKALLVHTATLETHAGRTLTKGVHAVTLPELLQDLA